MIRGMAASAVLLVAATGCSGGTVDSTEIMCDDFAAHAKAGLPESERLDVARGLAAVRANADPAVAEASEMLSRTATEPGDAYQIAADTFAQACFDWGWGG